MGRRLPGAKRREIDGRAEKMTGEEYLEQQMVTIVCEACVRRMEKSYTWVKHNVEFHCTCGATINLQADRVRKMLAAIETEAAKLG